MIVFLVSFAVTGIFLPEWLLGDNWQNRNNGADENKGLFIMIAGLVVSVLISLKLVDVFGTVDISF
jgi:hypothetical protein